MRFILFYVFFLFELSQQGIAVDIQEVHLPTAINGPAQVVFRNNSKEEMRLVEVISSCPSCQIKLLKELNIPSGASVQASLFLDQAGRTTAWTVGLCPRFRSASGELVDGSIETLHVVPQPWYSVTPAIPRLVKLEKGKRWDFTTTIAPIDGRDLHVVVDSQVGNCAPLADRSGFKVELHHGGISPGVFNKEIQIQSKGDGVSIPYSFIVLVESEIFESPIIDFGVVRLGQQFACAIATRLRAAEIIMNRSDDSDRASLKSDVIDERHIRLSGAANKVGYLEGLVTLVCNGINEQIPFSVLVVP